ncbi:MAG: RNA methyltransferase [Candidatus Moranbacteria bacterium]|nr:RNA methyltransferase [Candidatus Moranbacteria bacterium]
MKRLVLIIHNVRSAHNVGSLFRTADGVGVQEVFLTGYTPAPPKRDALYLTDAEKSFKKTALGAEKYVVWQKQSPLGKIITMLKKQGYKIVALEQATRSIDYQKYVPEARVALIVGNEVHGVDAKILKQCDTIIEIPMYGEKNSLNVSVAGGIALYQIKGTMKKRE